jgi:hypothetical protein
MEPSHTPASGKISAVVLLAILLGTTSLGHGALIVISQTETDLTMAVDIQWTPGTTAESVITSLTRWEVRVGVSAPMIGLLGTEWSFSGSARHLFDPHPPLGELGGGALADAAATGGPLTLPAVFIGSGLSFPFSLAVPHGSIHADQYFARIDLPSSFDGMLIQVGGSHVPEPNAIYLMIPAFVVLIMKPVRERHSH